MMLPKCSFRVFVACTAILLAVPRPAAAFDFYWRPVGTGNYATGSNWDEQLVGNQTTRLPNGNLQEVASIINGGTAELSTVLDPINTDGPNPAPGGVRLGSGPQNALTGTGTLRIVAGGSLTTLNTGGDANGNVVVGEGAGTGTLIMTGGTLTTPTALQLGGAAASAIRLSGNAAVNVATATLGRELRITGPSVNFNATGAVTLQGGGTYTAEITSATHSPIKSTAGVTLGGNLAASFSGVTPAQGQSWTLVDAASINGSFANATNVTVTGAPAPAVGLAYRLNNVAGGNGRQLKLGLDPFLVLRVNRDTGELTIRNPQGAPVTQLTGYTISSPTGGSLVSGYKGISGAPAGDAGWEKVPANSANNLGELKPSGVFNASSNATSVSLGNGFSKTAVAAKGIGISGEDLAFNYTTFGGSVTSGVIEYVGTPFLNNLVLNVSPTGAASLKNDTNSPLSIDGYTILSSTGGLNGGTWNSLADQAGTFPNWQESPTSANVLSETNPVSPTSIAVGASIPIGNIGTFGTDAAKNGVSLKFIIGNEIQSRVGTVVFASASTTLPGDYNGSGRVDGNDFLAWQKALGSTVPAGTGADGDGNGTVGAGDLAVWRTNFGSGSSAGAAAAVPEPGAAMLAAFAAAIVPLFRRRVAPRRSLPQGINGKPVMKTKHLSLVAAALACVAPSISSAQTVSLGLNFAATDPDAVTSSLNPTDAAGVVPSTNWNNLPNNGGTSGPLVYNNNGASANSTVAVTWSSPNTWRAGGNDALPPGPNQVLLSGYLDSTELAGGGVNVSVTNIDAALRTPGYDVYVYMVGDSPDNRGGSYTLTEAGRGPVVKFGSTLAAPTAFVEDLGTDADNSVDGNYLRFNNLTGSSFTLVTNAAATNGFRAPINAIQIVKLTPAAGDANGDGSTNIADYNLIKSNMEKQVTAYTSGDLTGDGLVDLSDFGRWQAVAPAAVVNSIGVPEPATFGLAAAAAISALGLARRSRRMAMRRSAALVAAVISLGASTVASAQNIGIKFASDDAGTETSTLNPTDIAGVIPAANWNNLPGPTGTDVGSLVYNNASNAATPSGITVTWTSPNTWRSTTGNNMFPAGPNRVLTNGYLDSNNTAAGGVMITVNGVDAALRAPAYDVYVYFVGDSGANRGGGYTVTSGAQTLLKYGSSMGNPTTFVEDPGTDQDLSVDGNYLRFRGITGASFTLTSNTEQTNPNGFRAPVNAIQIVKSTLAPGPGDVNEDGLTNINDYNIIKTNFFKTTGVTRLLGDLNLDGRVGLEDFTLWRNNVPAAVASQAAVPEPGSAALALSGAALLVRTWRRRTARG